MILGGTLRAARTSVSRAGGIVLALTVALLSGALLGMELVPPLWVVAGVFGVVFLAWVSVVAPFETAILWLIGSVVFQNYLTPNLAFWVSPAYILGVIVFARLLVGGRYRRVAAPMDGPVRAWLLLAIVSLPVAFFIAPTLPKVEAGLRYAALRPVFQFLALLLSVLPYFALVTPLARDRALYSRALGLFVAVGTAVSLFALYQQAAYYLGFTSLSFLAGPGTESAGFSLGGKFVFRSNATFIEPLNLGLFLVAAIAVTLSLLAADRRPLDALWSRGRLALALVVQTAALVVTFSGGAYVGFLAACIVFLVLVRSRVRAVLSLLVLAAAIFGGALLIARVTSGLSAVEILTSRPLSALELEAAVARSSAEPGYEYSRTPYRRASFELLRRYPLTGVGIGNFGAGAVMVDPQLRADAGSQGVPWGLIGEYGLPGAILLLYFLVTFLSAVGGAYRRRPTQVPELGGFLAGFIGIAVQLLTYGYSRLEPMIWVFIAMAMAAGNHARSEERSESAYQR